MISQIARIAWPLIGAQLAIALMTFIDTVLMGQLGVEVLAGGGLGSVIYQFVYIVFIGVLMAVANLIAFARGNKQTSEIQQLMMAGIAIAMLISFLSIVGLFNIKPLLLLAGQDPLAVEHAVRYLEVVSWSLIPAFMFVLVRSLLMGFSDTALIFPVSAFAAAMNYPLSYVLMTGQFGLPALGLEGIALGTCIICLLMCAGLGYFTFRQQRYRIFLTTSLAIKSVFSKFKEILKLGIPISTAYAMEIGLFSAAAFLVGSIGITELAAHQVALQATTLSFMVPLAISQAVSVKVGALYGANQTNLIPVAVKAGIQLAFCSAFIAALVFYFAPQLLVDVFVDQSRISTESYHALFSVASQVLIVAAVFQLVDGWQVIFMGALRGLKLGLSPTLAAIFSYWVVGFPCSYWLMTSYSAVGVWMGMGVGLAVSAALLAGLLRGQLKRASL